MNIRLWELDNGDLINLEEIALISKIIWWKEDHYEISVIMRNGYNRTKGYLTKDEAELARFKLVERWNACLDMIYSQTWCPESGTYSSSSKPTKEDKFEGYKESGH